MPELTGAPIGGAAVVRPSYRTGAVGGDGAIEPENPRGRVLLAEHNDVNQRAATAILARLGYHTDVVDNGLAAVDRAGLHPYDAVLMDLQMPGLDGYDATTELRHREGDQRHTPVIALAARATQEERDRALAAGMDDYLAKPIMPGPLQAVLERWAGEHAQSRS